VILKTLFVLQVHYKFITSVFETYTIIFEQKVNAQWCLITSLCIFLRVLYRKWPTL